MTSMSRRPGNLYWLLTTQPAFRQLTARTWREVFRPAMALLLGEAESGPEHMLKSLEAYAGAIRASAAMNFERWGINREAAPAAGGSFEKAIRYLDQWIRIRVEFMDGENTEEIQSPD